MLHASLSQTKTNPSNTPFWKCLIYSIGKLTKWVIRWPWKLDQSNQKLIGEEIDFYGKHVWKAIAFFMFCFDLYRFFTKFGTLSIHCKNGK